MNNIYKLRNKLKEALHPGHEIVSFACSKSNSPEFIWGVAHMLLEAAKADIDREEAWMDSVIKSLREESRESRNELT